MSLDNTRDISVPISVSNVKAHFEELLRRYKYIDDDEDLVDLSIGKVERGFDIKGQEQDVVTLRYKTKREEVEVVRHW